MRIYLVPALVGLASFSAHAEDYYFQDGRLNIDKQKYLEELEKLQLDIKDPAAGLFSKHRYCVRCTSGERLNCDVPLGGEAGRAMCGTYGMAKCKSSGGQVDYNGCP